jgi:hypothetical protein
METPDITFESVIEQHRQLIANVLRRNVTTVGCCPAQFIDQVEQASEFASASPACASDSEEMETAHRYLMDAHYEEDPAARAVLLSQAHKHLVMVDPTDWLG